MANEFGAGRKHAKGLFKQYAEDYPDLEQIYDLDEFHTVFLECRDITEYEPAMKLVGDWQEWLRLKRDWATFSTIIDTWKDELIVKLQSEAMAKLIEIAQEASPQTAASVNKFIVQAGWEKRGAGRPTKSQIEQKTKEELKKAQITEDEADRVFEVVEGGK